MNNFNLTKNFYMKTLLLGASFALNAIFIVRWWFKKKK